eukprot:gnl/TRDRNA2_/TRDRNA2_81915_c0_seq1.p3 gnl/TRDRNA2_/TRDRNA2_81915_c0~~gnl/TRDRNA2_/TRDRNA2_81915_c0_seq1.p3  ORF type:complete len:127 (+),score=29.99 gnl/TRDRNA2_/TRDRNA2_81915_c0_seq1:116-496(+)
MPPKSKDALNDGPLAVGIQTLQIAGPGQVPLKPGPLNSKAPGTSSAEGLTDAVKDARRPKKPRRKRKRDEEQENEEAAEEALELSKRDRSQDLGTKLPTCRGCACTVAVHLGMVACVLCRSPLTGL